MLRLGLTGGIGSGKSTVASFLGTRGASIIDADAISRASTQAGGSAIPVIREVFGAEFVTENGSLDRQRMRDRVFTDSTARSQLEAIVHPIVKAEIQRLVNVSTASCLVFDVPLLVESPHWRCQLDRVIVVDCTAETQVNRVQKRNDWDRQTIEAIVNSQASRIQRLAAADIVVLNDSNQIEPLERLVGEMAHSFGL